MRRDPRRRPPVVDVPDATLAPICVPVTATVPAGMDLVAEVFTPDGQADGNFFWIGSNNNGQTGPSYIAAADCFDLPEPLEPGDRDGPLAPLVCTEHRRLELVARGGLDLLERQAHLATDGPEPLPDPFAVCQRALTQVGLGAHTRAPVRQLPIATCRRRTHHRHAVAAAHRISTDRDLANHCRRSGPVRAVT